MLGHTAGPALVTVPGWAGGNDTELVACLRARQLRTWWTMSGACCLRKASSASPSCLWWTELPQ